MHGESRRRKLKVHIRREKIQRRQCGLKHLVDRCRHLGTRCSVEAIRRTETFALQWPKTFTSTQVRLLATCDGKDPCYRSPFSHPKMGQNSEDRTRHQRPAERRRQAGRHHNKSA